MPNNLQKELEEIAKAIYLYGYERAKKGLNRRNGYIKDDLTQ